MALLSAVYVRVSTESLCLVGKSCKCGSQYMSVSVLYIASQKFFGSMESDACSSMCDTAVKAWRR